MSEPFESQRKTDLKAVISFFVILGIILLTILGIILMKLNKPSPKEKPSERSASVVNVFEAVATDHRSIIESQGVVESARQTQLSSEVSGRVIEISPSFMRGGVLKAGEKLLQIDPADYRAAVASAEVRLREAELEREIEQARSEQALLDWEKIGRGEPQNSLVLREPYLAAAKARSKAAEQELARAQRNLQRCEIIAPFDAAIRSKEVEIGSFLGVGMKIASLYASQDLEVRLPLSLEDLGFLSPSLTQDSSVAVLKGKIGGFESQWKAQLVRIDPEISRETLSAHIVLKVLPNASEEHPFPPVGLFVRAEVQGKTLQKVIEIPRKALMDSSKVMLANSENRLEFREVKVLRLTQNKAVIGEGLNLGDRVITSRLPAPIQGLPIQVNITTEEVE